MRCTLPPYRLALGYLRSTILTSLLLLLYLAPGQLVAQVIDESTPQDSIWVAVGADSTDFVAQDFVASVKRVRKLGVWLKTLSGTGEVRLSLMKDNGFNQPDRNFILHESDLITPDTAGGWVFDSTFSAVFNIGEKYWVVIDGYNNLAGSGYAAVGTSHTFTSTSGPLRYSTDGGANWPAQQGLPLAIHVEGDNCSFPLAVFPVQPLICPGGQSTFGVPSGFVSYIWASGQTSSTIVASAPGIYSVTAVDAANCTATAAVVVVPGTIPYTNFLNYYEICEGSPLILTLQPFYSTYFWSDGTVGLNDTIEQSGTYSVTITSNSGCVTVDSFDVFVRPYAVLDLGRDSSLCDGDSIFLDVGTGYTSILWSTGSMLPRDTLTGTTNIWVHVLDSSGCFSYSDTVDYTFGPVPGMPIVQVLPTGLHASFAFSYTWLRDGQILAGQSAQDIADPLPGLYNVIIGNAFGCTAMSDTVRVHDGNTGDFVSGGFSPNGDGLNETFFVEGIGRYPEITLRVLNRWGDQVYLARPYRNDWNGSNASGGDLPVGDYFYILDFGAGRETLQGTVTISR
jgi:gliding motility-associated-like protein